MPAVSRAQRIVMAIAEHNPSQLSTKNRGVLAMNKQQLHDFASNKEKGLPAHVPKEAKRTKKLKVSAPRGGVRLLGGSAG